jgi:hypothetical protein
MPTQACLNNIASEKPPYNVSCTPNFCVKTSFARNLHCSTRGLPMDTPVLSWDPDLHGGQACYCCCSCFALNTPIEAQPGKFMMIQDIYGGDTIMATGLDLKWTPTKVKYRSGDVEPSVVPGMYYFEYSLPNKSFNYLLVTPDHLFLMYGTKTLKKVQYLVPGDKLMTPDGDAAIVQFVTHGEQYTAIQSIEMEGPLNPKTLTGHLINSNGVVTADYLVQSAYELGDTANALHSVPPEEEEHEVGSEEYERRHPVKRALTFAETPESWPKGFVPDSAVELPVPIFATGYVTPEQAKAISKNGSFNPVSNVTGRANVFYLFEQSRRLYPDIICILDWRARSPNAYAWQSGGQKFILLSGALVRLKQLYIDGLSLILASLQASLQRQACVCEWDYEATSAIARRTWPDDVLATLIPAGIQQLEHMFSLVKPDDEPDGKDPCDLPALDCRIKSYWAGFSFFGIPECAGVYPHYLEIGSAYVAIDNKTITIAFNDDVDPASATDPANYLLTPATMIDSAVVNPATGKEVLLKVSDLDPASDYVLRLENLTSIHGSPLGPDQDKVIITTHAV